MQPLLLAYVLRLCPTLLGLLPRPVRLESLPIVITQTLFIPQQQCCNALGQSTHNSSVCSATVLCVEQGGHVSLAGADRLLFDGWSDLDLSFCLEAWQTHLGSAVSLAGGADVGPCQGVVVMTCTLWFVDK